MSVFNFYDCFWRDLAHGKHQLNSHELRVALSNTAPNRATHAVFGDINEITPQNGYTAGGELVVVSSSEQVAGLYELITNDPTFLSDGGLFGPFRYAIFYNNTQSSPNKPLIGWGDNNASISLDLGQGMPANLSQTDGMLRFSMLNTNLTYFDQFVEDLAHGVHNLGSDTIKAVLTNVLPDTTNDAVLTDITEITAQNGYSAGGATLSISSSGQSNGVYKLLANDFSYTGSGGTFGPFQWIVYYNNTPTSPLKPLIGWKEYDQQIPLRIASGEVFPVKLDQTNGLIRFSLIDN